MWCRILTNHMLSAQIIKPVVFLSVESREENKKNISRFAVCNIWPKIQQTGWAAYNFEHPKPKLSVFP